MGKLPLEGFKFAVYIVMPVVAVTYFQRPEVFRKIIENRNYIQYPPEEERSPEELINALQKKKQSDDSNTVGISSSSMMVPSSSLSSSSKIGTHSSEQNTPSVPWRRYIFFGPRDDPDALKRKRAKKV